MSTSRQFEFYRILYVITYKNIYLMAKSDNKIICYGTTRQ